jgi:hypothetical protein
MNPKEILHQVTAHLLGGGAALVRLGERTIELGTELKEFVSTTFPSTPDDHDQENV